MLDLGAGTGKLTAVLAALGADVVAVEPDAAMLAELRRALPKVATFTGDAEAIPLADASVDAVLAGNAMHWFDMDVAGPQIARVLTKGGTLAGVWNLFDDRVGWVAELARISGAAAIGSRDTLTRLASLVRCGGEVGLRARAAADRGITPGDVRDEGGNAGHAGTGTRHDAQPDPCVPHE